jgi:hypothetical protein
MPAVSFQFHGPCPEPVLANHIVCFHSLDENANHHTHTSEEFIGGEISHRERSVFAAARFKLAAIPHPISVTQHNLRVHLRLNVPHSHGPAHKSVLFLKVSLCLTRACLGKMISFLNNKRGSNKGVFSPIRRAAKDLRFARRLEHAAVPYPTLACSKKFQKLNAAESARASERERERGGTRRRGRASHRVAEGVLVVAAGGAILARRLVFIAQQIHEATPLHDHLFTQAGSVSQRF